MHQGSHVPRRSSVPRQLLLTALFSFAGHGALLAQIDGKVVGTVVDRATDRPLTGASVTVAGTTLGNVTDDEGHYFLNHVPVGVQGITASIIGYGSQERRLRILAGHTSTIHFALESTPVEAEGLVAVIEREPLIVRDRTGSKSHFTQEEAVELPVETVDDLVALSAGVYRGQDGYIIRGGRGTESATYVDGVLTTDFTTQRDLTGIGTFAIEEIDVVTGGFSAEYGYAQSGLINVVTRSGSQELQGNVRYTTDGRYGTDGLDLEERRAMETEACCGYHSLQMALGGPVVPGRMTMFGSLEATAAADFSPHEAGFNPMLDRLNSTGSTESILPGNRGDRTNLQLKSSASVPGLGEIDGTLLFTRNQGQRYSSGFQTEQQLATGSRSKTVDAIVSLNRTFQRLANREISLLVRGHFHRSDFRTGVPRSPAAAAILSRQLGAACGAECDVTDDFTEGDFLNFRFGDMKFFFEDSLPGTVHNLQLPRSTRPDAVFGTTGIFRDDGFPARISHAEEERATVRVDLDTQVDRFNRLKIGTEWTWIDLDRSEGFLHNQELADLYHVRPIVGAVYAQHRWDGGDLVVDLGLRWDHWDPNTTFPAIVGIVPCEMAALRFHCQTGAATREGRKLSALAPRLGIAHPLTDRAQVRLNFGRFHQLPELGHYFQSYRIDAEHFRGTTYGNPDLGYVQTTALELGVTWLVARNTALDIVGYVRDRQDAIRAEWYQPRTLHPDLPEVRVFVNGDHGNVKGADFTLNRRLSANLSADLTWSLQWARGTTSSPLEWVEGFGALHDPLHPGRLLLPPNALSPDSYDRLHNLDGRLIYAVPEGYREGTRLGWLLENVRAAFTYTARSGTPYTRSDPNNRYPVGPPRGHRFPWTHDGNFRLVKSMTAGTGIGLDAFLQVNNVFGTRNVLSLHSTTGIVDRDGTEEIQSSTPVIRRDLLMPGVLPIYPVRLEDVLPEFRELLGVQDLDGDGAISREEAQEMLYRAVIASGSDSPYSYGGPRTIRFGLELRF